MAVKDTNLSSLADYVWATWKEVLLKIDCIYKTNEKERQKAKQWNIIMAVVFLFDTIVIAIGSLSISAVTWVGVVLTILTGCLALLGRLSSIHHRPESELHISEELATELSCIAGQLDILFGHLYQREWKTEYSKELDSIKTKIASLDVKCDRAIHDLTDSEINEVNARIDHKITHKYVNHGE